MEIRRPIWRATAFRGIRRLLLPGRGKAFAALSGNVAGEADLVSRDDGAGIGDGERLPLVVQIFDESDLVPVDTAGQVGLAAAKVKIDKVYVPPKGDSAEILKGSTDEVVKQLVGKIKELGLL